MPTIKKTPDDLPEKQILIKGDIDRDGEVTEEDYSLCRRFIIGTRIPTDDELSAADIDGDGVISYADAAVIYKLWQDNIKS